MLLDNTLAGGCLAALLLSTAHVDAFSLRPARSVASSCTRKVAGHSEASSVLAQARPGWFSRRVIGGRPLGMTEAPGSIEEVALTHLEEREFQLEELEDKDVMETSVVLEPGGSVTAGTTNGPLPMSSEGTWTYDGKVFSMVLSRTFDASISPYVVRREYKGYVDEVLPATDTVILTGDITMDDNAVGYFKMISAPSDILDSLKNIDDKITRVNNK